MIVLEWDKDRIIVENNVVTGYVRSFSIIFKTGSWGLFLYFESGKFNQKVRQIGFYFERNIKLGKTNYKLGTLHKNKIFY